MAASRVRSAVARCGTQEGGSMVRLAVVVGGEMRSRPLAGCVAATSPVSGEMLGGRPLFTRSVS